MGACFFVEKYFAKFPLIMYNKMDWVIFFVMREYRVWHFQMM